MVVLNLKHERKMEKKNLVRVTYYLKTLSSLDIENSIKYVGLKDESGTALF